MNRRSYLSLMGGFAAFSLHAGEIKDFKEGIKIGFLPITDHLPIIASSLYKDEKFKIIPTKFSNWANVSEALRAGAIDGAFLLAPLGLNLRASGVKIKAVLSAHKNGSSLVVDKNINSIKELNNKKIAVPSKFSTHFFLLSRLLKQNNITANIIDMPPPEMPFALINGQIDAFIVAEPFGQIAVSKGAKNLIFSKDIQNNHICCLLNLREELISKIDVNEFINSFKKAAVFIDKNHDEASKLASEITAQKSKVIKNVLDKDIISYSDFSLKDKDIEELKEFLISNSLGSKNLASLDVKDYLL